jgi:hypothetical protein
MVLDLGANPTPGVGHIPLKEGVANTWISMFGLVSVAYAILSFHHAHNLVQGLRGTRSELWDANLPEDMARQEVSRAFNEKMWTRKETEREQIESIARQQM